ncbi:serine/threonine-protein kinase [Nocardioides marmoraquaticus]
MISGRYTRVRPIGRGGTGSVWLGRDEALGRDVALKRIGVLPGGEETDLARAEREAQLAARLHHPHVVTVLDVVTDEETDTRWLVMEHVEGRDLGAVVRDDGPLAPEEAARLLGQVADALVAAHEVGMVHRDVKPSNVLVDASGEAKLTDFGIARLVDDPSLTQTGLVVGSPAYLAPEVARGSRGDERVDAWSWGATLFHVLSGQAPYQGGETMGTLYRLVNEPAPRLTEAGPLAPVLAGAMTKDPDRRWSMVQVRDFLRDGTVPADLPDDPDATRAVPVVPPEPATTPLTVTGPAADVAVPVAAPEPSPRRDDRRRLAALVVAALVLVAGAVWLVLRLDAGDTSAPAAGSPSASAGPAAEPTAEGMERFVSDYVAATGDDPARSWEMLTDKFQRESGGFETYAEFWGPASNGRVTDVVSADPDTLRIAYQVRFDTWDNGPGPTRLQLAFDPETDTYKIDGETSAGFVPAG